MAEEPVVICLI